MAGKGGGAWKVAYADFVTAMMAFFMVMWITAQNETVKEAIAHHFQDPFDTMSGEEADESRPARGNGLVKPRDGNDHDTKKRKAPRPMLVQVVAGGDTATGTVIFFADDSADLDVAAKEMLDSLLPYLIGKPQKIEIRGHSSRRPLPAESPFTSYWELSYARCLATMKHLQEQGIPAERIRLSQAGVFEPQTDPSSGDAVGQSRVEVRLLDEVVRGRTSEGEKKASPPPRHEPSEPAEHAPESHTDQHPAASAPPADKHSKEEQHSQDDHTKDEQGKDEHHKADHTSQAADRGPSEPAHEPPTAAADHAK